MKTAKIIPNENLYMDGEAGKIMVDSRRILRSAKDRILNLYFFTENTHRERDDISKDYNSSPTFFASFVKKNIFLK